MAYLINFWWVRQISKVRKTRKRRNGIFLPIPICSCGQHPFFFFYKERNYFSKIVGNRINSVTKTFSTWASAESLSVPFCHMHVSISVLSSTSSLTPGHSTAARGFLVLSEIVSMLRHHAVPAGGRIMVPEDALILRTWDYVTWRGKGVLRM